MYTQIVSMPCVVKFISDVCINVFSYPNNILPDREYLFKDMVTSYLPHATPTPELRKLVSVTITRRRSFPFVAANAYCSIIHQWVRRLKLFYYTHTQ